MRDPDAKTDTPLMTVLAFSVHIFTASGAVFALFALFAAIERNWLVKMIAIFSVLAGAAISFLQLYRFLYR